MASERNRLPGSPPIKLIKDVRRILFNNMRIRPRIGDDLWQKAWIEANQIRYRRISYRSSIDGRKPSKWPNPNEIATLYILFAMGEMIDYRALRLPLFAERPEVNSELEGIGATKVFDWLSELENRQVGRVLS